MSGNVLGALGLCRRAGALICGTPMICIALREGKKRPFLVVAASGISDGTKKKLADKCGYYNTPMIEIKADGEALAASVGKTGVLAAVAVTDKNLAELVKGSLGKNEKDN